MAITVIFLPMARGIIDQRTSLNSGRALCLKVDLQMVCIMVVFFNYHVFCVGQHSSRVPNQFLRQRSLSLRRNMVAHNRR